MSKQAVLITFADKTIPSLVLNNIDRWFRNDDFIDLVDVDGKVRASFTSYQILSIVAGTPDELLQAAPALTKGPPRWDK